MIEERHCEHCGGLMLRYPWADGLRYSWVHAIHQEADACMTKRINELVGDGK